MSVGALSDIFIQAEIDYRHERAMAEAHPKPHAQRVHHRPWPLNRDSARSRRTRHSVVG